ncbi:AT-hook motif nuclear-localized protein 9 [Abeliophyllum distichum]|uniref:AT-hook motif nuclear-localized protein n=1 Tax=Abeliophyllum distichum TaxID=126358 RepID=A0ABD1UKM2_9LAMI
MDGREGMTLSGSASYYFNRGGVGGSGPNAAIDGGGSGTPQAGGVHFPAGFNSQSDLGIAVQPSAGVSGVAISGSTFQVENPSPNFPRSISMAAASNVSPGGDSGKKKRGRPRKYAPEGSNMSLALSPMSSTPSSGVISSGEKSRRGRPPGTGRKQQLASLGEWVNSSAGLAFTPHVLHIGVGEDVAAKVLSFAQQRPRALCILSAKGSVSIVTLRQPITSGSIVTYEGRFEILCLSGSYLLAESGGPRNRTGGISISICSPDGHIIGGAIGGRLIAASPVQVVVFSFVYGGSKSKNITESNLEDEKNAASQSAKKLSIPITATPIQTLTPNSATSIWPTVSRQDLKISQPDIDLMHG